MNVFELRDRLIHDYSSYRSSFIEIRDERIRQNVNRSLEEGLLWPEPLIQLNPSFEPGGRIDELVSQGILHEECTRVFRIGKVPQGGGKPLQLHKHQADAIRLAREGHNYVLTTGTGSGKSLAYIVPIVDHVLRHGSGRGIQAIIVYPMNAPANSQFGELQKFLCHGYPDGKGPATFQRYTGQESEEEKNRIVEKPPDILLTNYVMLELILTRPRERNLIKAAQGLKFLVLDELHTYRGRQGADVALLVRRVRDALAASNLQCVGTSATLAGSGTYVEQRSEVAKIASLLFGARVDPEHVIGETLRRATPETKLDDPGFIAELTRRVNDSGLQPPPDYTSFIKDPLSVWIESTLGVTTEPSGGRLIRTKPRSILGEQGAAKDLSRITGLAEDRCITALQEGLLSGYLCRNPETDFPAFAFRRYQAIRHLLADSGSYPVCGRGRINSYAVFAEVMATICSESGRVGAVVPAGIATDDNTKNFFRELIDNERISSLFCFDNTERLFPGIKSSLRFGLLTVAGSHQSGTSKKQAEFVFFAHHTDEIHDPARRFTLTRDDIALLNPNTRTCPVFRSKRDAEITKALHQRVPVFLAPGKSSFCRDSPT